MRWASSRLRVRIEWTQSGAMPYMIAGDGIRMNYHNDTSIIFFERLPVFMISIIKYDKLFIHKKYK